MTNNTQKVSSPVTFESSWVYPSLVPEHGLTDLTRRPCKQHVKLSNVIFMHRIADTSVGSTADVRKHNERPP